MSLGVNDRLSPLREDEAPAAHRDSPRWTLRQEQAGKVKREEKEEKSSPDSGQPVCSSFITSTLRPGTFPSLSLLGSHFVLQDRRAGRGCLRGRERSSERRPGERRGVGVTAAGSHAHGLTLSGSLWVRPD